jgi:hypothetical protein
MRHLTPIMLTTLLCAMPAEARQPHPASPALQRASRLARDLKPRTPLARRAPLLRAVGKLNLKSRCALAEQLVRRRLGWSDRVTIRRAHRVAAKRGGRYTKKDLARKQRILRRRFSAKESRLLMESGVTGLKDKLVEAFAVWNAGDGYSSGRMVDAREFARKHGLDRKQDKLFGESFLGYTGDPGVSQRARGVRYLGREHLNLVTEDYYH